jgi:acyl carrier protein
VDQPGNTVPIGRPIVNTQIYLLDAELKPVHEGEDGELFIGGDGVARGYWKRPELTAEKFVEVPSISSQRIYRTGDLARLMQDGNFEFLGRADFQIKLRGHRIEPGEIEALLEQSPGVRQAVIVVREDREGDQRLVAYLVADSDGTTTSDTLRNELGTRLPEAMVPSAFVFLPELPLNANGKIDRKALLRLPPPGIRVTSTASHTGNQSVSEIEFIVAQAWQEALGVSEVGVNDNFFDLGAHSLTVAEVQAKLQNALHRDVSIVDLFQFSTISSLSGHLAGTQSHSQLSDRAERRRLARQR